MEKNDKQQIEAILFASGRVMDVTTISSLTGISSVNNIKKSVKQLETEYNERGSPMMIVQEKDGWKITVREQYLPLVRQIVSETELPKTVIETLGVIAWKSPVVQSEIIAIRHNKAYDHINVLEELGFIRREVCGRSYMIKTTEKFYEYFDVENGENIRDIFRKVVGKPETLENTDNVLTNKFPESDDYNEIDEGVKLLFQ